MEMEMEMEASNGRQVACNLWDSGWMTGSDVEYA
jgi:hypothetical protein